MLNDARQRLANVARDPSRYAALMDGLVLQVSDCIIKQYSKQGLSKNVCESYQDMFSYFHVSGFLPAPGTQSDHPLSQTGCGHSAGLQFTKPKNKTIKIQCVTRNKINVN